MNYSIELDPLALAAFDTQPQSGALALAEVFAVLQVAPYSGRSINQGLNPDGAVRTMPFGTAGMVTYLVVDDEQRVDVLVILRAA